MKTKKRQFGFTLIEMLVVISIIVIFISLSLPAVNKMMQSNKTGQAESLIKSYFALAKAHAAQTQKYAGVRFQLDLEGNQHLVLIEKSDLTYTDAFGAGNSYTLTYRFTAVSNTKTAKFPDNVRTVSAGFIPDLNSDDILDQDELDNYEWNNFSIIFSPTGQVVQKECLCLPRAAYGTTQITLALHLTPPVLPLQQGQFDDRVFAFPGWPTISGIGTPFISDAVVFKTVATPYIPITYLSFIVYDVDVMKNTSPDQRISYLTSALRPSVINMYTGEILDLDEIR